MEPMHWTVGDVKITRIVEIELPTSASFLFGRSDQITPEALDAIQWLRPHFVDDQGRLLLSIHALVVESEGRRILVDTCVGNDKQRSLPGWNMRQGPFLDDLTEAGFPPSTIDTVLCTHLHVDHVGWNTRWENERWVPTFSNARYLFARPEWEHWSSAPEDAFGPVVQDSVRPIVDAGLADLVECDHRLTDEVHLEPTPGHTPGHVSVRIVSQGKEAVITGDMTHHPCQFARPEWSATVDSDRRKAEATRRHFLERTAGQDVLVIGTHFATPTAGYVVRDGTTFRFVTR